MPTAVRNKLTEKYTGYGHTEIGIESIKLEVVNVQKWSNSAE